MRHQRKMGCWRGEVGSLAGGRSDISSEEEEPAAGIVRFTHIRDGGEGGAELCLEQPSSAASGCKAQLCVQQK